MPFAQKLVRGARESGLISFFRGVNLRRFLLNVIHVPHQEVGGFLDRSALGYRSFRDQFVKGGKLVNGTEPDHYSFAANVIFPSPSVTAAVVL